MPLDRLGPPSKTGGLWEGAQAPFLTYRGKAVFQSESKWNQVGGFIRKKDKTCLKRGKWRRWEELVAAHMHGVASKCVMVKVKLLSQQLGLDIWQNVCFFFFLIHRTVLEEEMFDRSTLQACSWRRSDLIDRSTLQACCWRRECLLCEDGSLYTDRSYQASSATGEVY